MSAVAKQQQLDYVIALEAQLLELVRAFSQEESTSISKKQKALNFFSAAKSKICGGFQTAKSKVSAFVRSEKTAKVLNVAKKVAVIAGLIIAGVSTSFAAGAIIGAAFVATAVNPVFVLTVPTAIVAGGMMILISRGLFAAAAHQIVKF